VFLGPAILLFSLLALAMEVSGGSSGSGSGFFEGEAEAGQQGVGVVGHGIATNFIADKVPVAQLKSGAGKFGLGLGLAIAGSWAAFAFLPKKFATPLSVGMGTSVVVQGLNTFVFPKFPQLPVSGYESIDMLSGYEEVPGTDPGAFAGLEADRFESAFA
jgi:hypothetical protein